LKKGVVPERKKEQGGELGGKKLKAEKFGKNVLIGEGGGGGYV